MIRAFGGCHGLLLVRTRAMRMTLGDYGDLGIRSPTSP